MFATDKETVAAIEILSNLPNVATKPIVIWIGAGASRWAGHPSWAELAERLHRKFCREETAYDKEGAGKAIENQRFPDAFELMSLANRDKYRKLLAEALQPQQASPLYGRLVKALNGIKPLHILTTNADETLERLLSQPYLLQSTDVEKAMELAFQRHSFICKLHGSISSVATLVFTASEYENLKRNKPYLNSLRNLIAGSHVLFLGYGLQDEYVLQAIVDADRDRPEFGTGPHFLVTSNPNSVLPFPVRRITYVPCAPDHRGALTSVELLSDAFTQSSAKSGVRVSEPQVNKVSGSSTYFLADLIPVGEWRTSQTLEAMDEQGNKVEIIVGPGYVQDEIGLIDFSSLHDVAVGLLCFEKIAILSNSIGLFHNLVGSVTFWDLISESALRIFHHAANCSVIFESPSALVGDLGFFSQVRDGDKIKTLSLREHILRQLKPVPGHEAKAERDLERLEALVEPVDLGDGTDLAHHTRSMMVNPSIKRLLGISGGTPLSLVPRWLAFPTIRLSNVVLVGAVCQAMDAAAVRLVLGSESLAGAAFAASVGREWADSAAGYVLTGRFNADLGALLARQPSLLSSILRFRRSQEGAALRREVADQLASNEANMLSASLNAGLRQSVSNAVLDAARDQLCGLLSPVGVLKGLSPIVMGGLQNSDIRIAKWRAQSRRRLEETILRLKLKPYDICPCGSGEKLKFCCIEALSK